MSRRIDPHSRNALIAGLGLLVLVEGVIAWHMLAADCPAPLLIELLVLVGLPALYVPLIYLVFRSEPG